jgi:TATA-binding protein-associated factor
MSARERQQLKRKMKLATKSGTAFSVADATKKRKTGEVDSENATVVAYKPKPDISALSVFSTGDEWPFEGLVEKLSFDLFSPRWETRHGAAIGLREIIKIHGKGYGKVVGNTAQVNKQRNINVNQFLM